MSPKPTEKETEKVLIVPIEEEKVEVIKITTDLDRWQPKTTLGKMVKSKQLNTMDEVIATGKPILEPEIVDMLMPNLESDLLMIGQSKGKFGGGSRRVFRQTQKKTKEGNKPKFSTYAVVGNKDGYVGLGFGKAKETVPAREKAVRKAKLNLIRVVRGSGSWADARTEPNSIPFKVVGKCGSVTVELKPAPKGTGLKAQKEVAKVLRLAGIQDAWSKVRGQSRNMINVVKALEDALHHLNSTKIQEKHLRNLSIIYGAKPEKKTETKVSE